MILAGLGGPLFAQKIAYANLELVLAYLPETQQVGKQLQEIQAQKAQKLQIKRNYFDSKYQEYQEAAQVPGVSEESLLPLQQELQKLQREMQQETAKAEQEIARKQADLMAPILQKVEAEIKNIAVEKGYTYVLNSSASGSSIVLHGNEADEISKLLLSRFGVTIDN
ncbi:MAG: OmpH family outer membrane protein [Bacteroidia bacterium]